MYRITFKGSTMTKWLAYCGIAGVADDENKLARTAGRRLGYIVILAVMWMAVQWHLEMTGQISHDLSVLANFVIWMFFVIECSVLCFFVDHKLRYLSHNWLNLFIIVAGAIMLFSEYEPLISLLRSFRMILVVGILVPRLAQLKSFITDSRLEYSVLIAFFIVILAGITISKIEPNIHGIANGVWWAATTMTAVGYSDFITSTVAGRFLSGFLIISGIGIVATFTANLVLLFVQPYFKALVEENSEKSKVLNEINKELNQLTNEESEAIRLLRDIQIRLRHLEDQMDKKPKDQQEIVAKRK